MDRRQRKMLNLKILWRKYLSMDDAGTSTYDESIELPCYMAQQRKMVRTRGGEEVVSEISVYFDAQAPTSEEADSVAAISEQDQIVLPDNTTPPILRVSKYWDARGNLSLVEVSM